jgi:hypothetical protein
MKGRSGCGANVKNWNWYKSAGGNGKRSLTCWIYEAVEQIHAVKHVFIQAYAFVRFVSTLYQLCINFERR